MRHFLKNHPFGVEAFFEKSIVLTFAIPKEEAVNLIPECLTPDSFNDKWAFIAVAMVQTRYLRPKGFPRWMGQHFFLIGYRIFVRYVNNKGKRLRGLYILKSETDSKKMEIAGNFFTHYNYTTTDINFQFQPNGHLRIASQKSGFQVALQLGQDDSLPLPQHSPFSSWKEARRFAGPLPFTFTYDAHTRKVLLIEGVRQHWQPAPVQILDYQFSFLKNLHLTNPILANAFIVTKIPYYWKKGKTELWNP